MSANYNSTATPSTENLVQKLAAIAEKHPGRALFCTRFSAQDQVVTHLIFKHKLPIRVFTYSGADQYDILVRSVDYFGAPIEVSFKQARLNAADFAAKHPEVVRAYEKTPATAPLTQILQGHHLLISSRREAQLSTEQRNSVALEWDEANQRAIYYPLFDWSEKQVQFYVAHNAIPNLSALAEPVLSVAVSATKEQQTAAPSFWHNALQLITPKRRTNFSLKKSSPVADLFNNQRGNQAIFGLLE